MKVYVSIIFFVLMLSCNRSPYYVTNQQYKKQVKQLLKSVEQTPLKDSLNTMGEWVAAINFNLRKPNFVVIHHTAQNSCAQTLKTFTTKATEVSAHYVICRDGTIHHMLNDYLRAWHAGAGKWGGVTDINSSSIGIELDNNGFEEFSQAQINSLLQLLETLKKRYSIPATNFIGHADIAPTRKVDPSAFFPWKQLAEKGFGNWYDDTSAIKTLEYFKPMDALRIVGYDIKDSTAAIRSFRLHFMQDSVGTTLDIPAQKILFSLYKRVP